MKRSLIPCSVQVLTRNSEKNIQQCLETLAPFGEVIVQDGYSTDRTRDIASKFLNVRIMDQDKSLLDSSGRITDFSAMRNQSIAAATYDWVLVVDADEGIREDLTEEVRSIVHANQPGVYKAFRRFIVDGERVIHCAGYPAYQIRLFHRSCVDGYQKPVHERLAVRPGVAVQILKNELPVPMPPPTALDAKYDRYLAMEVKRLGVMPWGRWLRWILVRNLRSALGVTMLTAKVWLVPRKGKRMPIAYEWQAVRQSLRTIIRTFPLTTRRTLP